MQGSTSDNTLYYTNTIRVSNIRLGQIVSWGLGFLLIFSAPYGGGFFRDWLIPLWGYRISLFEVFAIPVVYGGLIYYGIRIKKYEQFLFLSILLVIFSRILSLLTAKQVELTQSMSVMRYVETLVIIYIFTNLFTDSKNRAAFIWGIIIGVVIELIGGIYIALSGAKGVFISIATFQLQIFLIIVCLFAFANKKHRFIMLMFILLLLLSIAASQVRTALIQLITVLVAAMWYAKRQKRILKPIVSAVLFSSIAIFLLAILFPFMFEGMITRTKSAIFSAEGNIYRYYLFDKALSTFLEYPITGIGSGGFARQQDYLPQIFGVELPPYYAELGYQLSTHNTFLGVLSETGVVGLTAYLLWVIAIIIISIKILRLADIKTNHGIYAVVASLMMIMFIISDLWSQNSFCPITNSLSGFMLGWLRANTKREINKWGK